jgi:hypothetical protein
MRQMGDETEKVVEVDDGDNLFQLKARYAQWNGRRVFVEYGNKDRFRFHSLPVRNLVMPRSPFSACLLSPESSDSITLHLASRA